MVQLVQWMALLVMVVVGAMVGTTANGTIVVWGGTTVNGTCCAVGGTTDGDDSCSIITVAPEVYLGWTKA
jgi:hypothetical protein